MKVTFPSSPLVGRAVFGAVRGVRFLYRCRSGCRWRPQGRVGIVTLRAGPWRPSISDLSTAEVCALAAAIGLSLDADDAPEVTHRLNAFLHALTPLALLPLIDVEPYPIDPRPSV